MPVEVRGGAADQVEAVAALGGLAARPAVADDRLLARSFISDSYSDAEQPPAGYQGTASPASPRTREAILEFFTGLGMFSRAWSL